MTAEHAAVLADFEVEPFTHDGATKDVYRFGSGPAVIVIAEMPGITPKVVSFAREVASQGLSVALPHLFGTPGVDAAEAGPAKGGVIQLRSLIPACVSREFTVLATGKSSPVVEWLRALAAAEHEHCGGPGVGAVGMCFTGGYALAMATDDRLLAPVLSQPSLPAPLNGARKANIDISPEELAVVKQRCASQGLQVLGLRFKGDRLVPSERFDFLRRELGDAFVAVELDDADAKPGVGIPPHSVLTEHLIDEPGQPTRAAYDQVLEHLRSRLLAA